MILTKKKRKEMIYDFISYAQLSQEKLKGRLQNELGSLGYKAKGKDGFVFARGDIPVLLVAHMDTVHRALPKNIWFSYDLDKITANEGIGGDDRCGIYIIMDILKKTKLRPNILFAEDEEIGGIGSRKFITRYREDNLDLDYIIEIDRRGKDDSVFYDLDNEEFEDYINSFGFITSWGSYTDICELCPHFKVAGVNLSSGYYNPHTTSEYVVLSEMLDIKNKVIKMLKEYYNNDYRHKWEWKENIYSGYDYVYYGYNYDRPSWVSKYNEENKLTNPYYVDLEDDKYSDVRKRDYCDYCGLLKDNTYDTELQETICEDCAEKYGMKHCVLCGQYTHNNTAVCEDCKLILQKQAKKEMGLD